MRPTSTDGQRTRHADEREAPMTIFRTRIVVKLTYPLVVDAEHLVEPVVERRQERLLARRRLLSSSAASAGLTASAR